ncbi:MAG: TIM barrel protein [Magnetococcales bacterium]|nr:TIM barrel protein [Magnetococcales bacterium]
MQGRLSPLMDGRIQSFPWSNWQNEFSMANGCNIFLMEWTLDQERLYENPLLTKDGQAEIMQLASKNQISIPSLTGDCFMQAPFWKAKGVERQNLIQDFLAVVSACGVVGIRYVVIPLVDNGSLENSEQENVLVEILEQHADDLQKLGVVTVFESDFHPQELKRFIARLSPELFGINYDIGNSAALGFKLEDEIQAYGQRVLNVHVKDRLLGGITVPLTKGCAKLPQTIAMFESIGYQGNYILQTARAVDNDHAGVLCRYRDMVQTWLGET